MNLVVVDPVAVELGQGVEDLAPGGDPGGDVVAGSLFLDHDEVEDFQRGLSPALSDGNRLWLSKSNHESIPA
jgi:hypothetical protein